MTRLSINKLIVPSSQSAKLFRDGELYNQAWDPVSGRVPFRSTLT